MHDLESDSIAYIYNNISRRKIGDPSNVSKFVGSHVKEFPDVFEPYYRTNWDGKQFKCVSVTVRDDKGKPVGLVCINFDTSAFQAVNQNIGQLLAVASKAVQNPVEQFTEDWQSRVNECIDNYLKENGLAIMSLTKDQKRAATNRLYHHGLFNYRNAASYIATRLDVSRATIYNYLKEGAE